MKTPAMIFLNALPSPDPESFDPSAVAGEICTICMCEIHGDGSDLCKIYPCNHVFHLLCLKQWLRRGAVHIHCPDCRQTAIRVYNYAEEIVWGRISPRFISRNWRYKSGDVERLHFWEVALRNSEILRILWLMRQGNPSANGELSIQDKEVRYIYNKYYDYLIFHGMQSSMVVHNNPFKVYVDGYGDRIRYKMPGSEREDLLLDIPLFWARL